MIEEQRLGMKKSQKNHVSPILFGGICDNNFDTSEGPFFSLDKVLYHLWWLYILQDNHNFWL